MRYLELLVLRRELVAPLTQRAPRVLHGAGDERGHRDERDERRQAHRALLEDVAHAGEPVGDEDRDVRHERDHADDERAAQAHRERRGEHWEEEEHEVVRAAAAGEYEEDRADDLRDGGADREAHAPEQLAGDEMEPKEREDREEAGAAEKPDARDRVGRGQGRGSDEDPGDAPRGDFRGEADTALVAALDRIPGRHSGREWSVNAARLSLVLSEVSRTEDPAPGAVENSRAAGRLLTSPVARGGRREDRAAGWPRGRRVPAPRGSRLRRGRSVHRRRADRDDPVLQAWAASCVALASRRPAR